MSTDVYNETPPKEGFTSWLPNSGHLEFLGSNKLQKANEIAQEVIKTNRKHLTMISNISLARRLFLFFENRIIADLKKLPYQDPKWLL